MFSVLTKPNHTEQQAVEDSGVTSHHPPHPIRTFKRREFIPLERGNLWQVESGLVRATTWNEDGSVISLGFWGSGDIVGSSLSSIDPYQVECLTAVKAMALPEDYQCSRQVLLSHVYQTEQLLKIAHSGSIEQRLLNFLTWIGHRFGRRGDRKQLIIDVRLTHQDMADTIGTTRVTVTRLLGKFQQEGVVDWSKQHLILTVQESL
jgi:CRP-like cAMP-binding protein